LSEAVAVTVVVALTVAPLAGAVTATVGGVVSALATVTVTAREVVVFAAASRARRRQDVRPVAHDGRVPRDRVGRRRILGAERRAVHEELHARDADVSAAVAVTVVPRSP